VYVIVTILEFTVFTHTSVSDLNAVYNVSLVVCTQLISELLFVGISTHFVCLLLLTVGSVK